MWNCLLDKLDAIISALGGSSGSANIATRGSGPTTIPSGAKEYSYVGVGGTIVVGSLTLPEGVSGEEHTPSGLSANITITNGTGVAYWHYVV